MGKEVFLKFDQAYMIFSGVLKYEINLRNCSLTSEVIIDLSGQS